MYRSRTKLGANSRTIGVLVDYPGGAYQTAVLAGIAETAAVHGANVLCFATGALAARPEARHSGEGIDRLMGLHNVDGAILLSGSLVHSIGRDGLVRLCALYADMPLCSVGAELDGAANVVVDNQAGVREAVAHLAADHGAERIAFIRGPDASAEAEERLEAYRSELANRGIAFDPKLVPQGDFMPESGGAAVRALAQTEGMRLETIDAIVACNDQMAMGALVELERMNVRVPEAMAVIGFDDIEESRLTHPALSTVRQPLAKLGAEAVRTVLARGAADERVRVTLDTELVKRESCGCGRPSGARNSSFAPPMGGSFETALVVRRQRIVNRVVRAASGRFGPAGPDWEGKLLNALCSDLRAEKTSAFTAVVQALAEKLLWAGVDLNLLDHVVGVLRREIVPLVRSSPTLRDCVEESFQLSRDTTSALIQRGLNRERLRLGVWTRTTAFVCNALSTAFDYAELRTRIKSELPKLGVRMCFVAVYEPASEPLTARLLVAYEANGKRPLYEGVTYHARTLLPSELVETSGDGRSFAILPLAWGAELLGHIMLDFDVAQFFAYEAIAEAVGGALHGAQLAGSRL
jgi:sigma-B regulation protein RsbU (phosphoserine phosphatase)